MKSSRVPILVLIALLVVCFSMAARLQPEFSGWRGSRAKGDIFAVVLGDGRKLFANEFYTKADEYYHSGYYPTMFDDNAAFQTAHMAADTGAVNTKNTGDEHGFLGPTRNWLDAFGRHFFPNRHTHLDEGGADDDLSGSENVREILPWLKLSTDLDPDNVQTYIVTAYWLRQRMHNVQQADLVLHEGLRNCPGSYDILFELGRLYFESYHDEQRARNVWEEGVRQWLRLDPQYRQGNKDADQLLAEWMAKAEPLSGQQKEDRFIMEQLTTYLAHLEETAGNLPKSVTWLKAALRVSATPADIQRQIDRLKYTLDLEFEPLLKPLY
jgi:hypothetical protein